MSQDNYYQRRKLLSKYNNKPPFNYKKPEEFYDIIERIRSYPDSSCKNCCGNRIIKEPIIDTIPKSSSFKSSIEDSKKTIPISYQRISPSTTMSKNTSIQTLYRNSNANKLGKNVPKHKLMKKLLQNFDSEGENSRKSFVIVNNINKDKQIQEKKQYFDKNEVIRTDFNVNVENKDKTKMPEKADKRTSTTGLPWPLNFKGIPSCCKCGKMVSNSVIEVETATSPSTMFTSNNVVPQKMFQRTFRTENNSFRQVSKSPEIVNSGISSMKKSKSPKKMSSTNCKYLANREKTFVQTQVEKLDKVMKKSKIPGPTYFNPNNSRLIATKQKNISYNNNRSAKKFERVETGYLCLMNRLKNKCPQFECPSEYYNRVKSDTDWTDYSETEPERITFPKETRIAVDQSLFEKRQPRPLSKFTKVQDCKPAVNIHDNKCFGDSYHNVPQNKPKFNKTHEENGFKLNKSKILIPCKKNLLCDKGEHHLGPCGYTHNHNKVIY